MNIHDIIKLLNDGLRESAMGTTRRDSLVSPWLTKAEAYRLYGRSNVDRWIGEGLLEPRDPRNGSPKKVLERAKLHAVASKCNRTTYLPTAER